MAKANFKTKLADKGEKYALIAAGGVMLLLMIAGVMNLSGSPDPSKFIQEVDARTTNLNSAMSLPDAKIAPLPKDVLNPNNYPPITSSWVYQMFFDPIAPPDTRRINPIVLAPVDIQADFMWAKILAFDIVDGKIAVLKLQKSKKGDKQDSEKATSETLQSLLKRAGPQKKAPAKKEMNMGGGEGKDGFNKPPGAMPERGQTEAGERYGVEYIPLDSDKTTGYRFALTILPQRMVIVQASFPLKAQLEELRNALRLPTLAEVIEVYKDINKDEETPRFRGLVVQRQVYYPDGKIETPWSDIDVATNYEQILRHMIDPKEEDPKTNYVLLHQLHELVMALPILMPPGKYPEIMMPTILETIKKMVALNKPPVPPKTPSRQQGGGSVWGGLKTNPGAAVGQPNFGGGGEGGIMQRNPMAGKEEGMGGANATAQLLEMDHMLLRIVDTDITPDRQYQYRIKVRMQNPNWAGEKDKKTMIAPFKQKYDFVSRPSDADVAMIEGPWCEMVDDKGKPKVVSVPGERFVFGSDPLPADPKDPNRTTITLKEGQGIVQIQRWMDRASVGNYKEPVGDWIVADVIATRGTYLGGKQFVNLPLWSSEFNKYILREAQPEKGKATPRRGVVMDPMSQLPKYVVAEVEGGNRVFKPLARNTTISEGTSTEVLLIDNNTGELQVRSAFADRADPGRVKREEEWRAWIERTEKDTQMIPGGMDPNKKEKGFD